MYGSFGKKKKKKEVLFTFTVLQLFIKEQTWKSGKRNIENQSKVSLSYAEWKARKDAFDIFEV